VYVGMDLGTNYLCYKTNTCVSQKKQIISDLAEKWRREQLKMFWGGGGGGGLVNMPTKMDT
jgi:hypothetical protein